MSECVVTSRSHVVRGCLQCVQRKICSHLYFQTVSSPKKHQKHQKRPASGLQWSQILVFDTCWLLFDCWYMLILWILWILWIWGEGEFLQCQISGPNCLAAGPFCKEYLSVELEYLCRTERNQCQKTSKVENTLTSLKTSKINIEIEINPKIHWNPLKSPSLAPHVSGLWEAVEVVVPVEVVQVVSSKGRGWRWRPGPLGNVRKKTSNLWE